MGKPQTTLGAIAMLLTLATGCAQYDYSQLAPGLLTSAGPVTWCLGL